MSDFPDEATRDEMAQLLSHPLQFPEEFKRWMSDFITTNIPMIPFSHIFGAKVNIAKSGDYISTEETIGAGTWVDVATVGPQVTGLADGRYLIAFGHKGRGDASLSFNGATALDEDGIYANESNPNSGRMIVRSVQNKDNNSICMKYQESGRSTRDRWLVVIRVGAPGEN